MQKPPVTPRYSLPLAGSWLEITPQQRLKPPRGKYLNEDQMRDREKWVPCTVNATAVAHMPPGVITQTTEVHWSAGAYLALPGRGPQFCWAAPSTPWPGLQLLQPAGQSRLQLLRLAALLLPPLGPGPPRGWEGGPAQITKGSSKGTPQLVRAVNLAPTCPAGLTADGPRRWLGMGC